MRIGCVPYGHAKPFAGAWLEQSPVWDHPKELARQLWQGELDLALVPVWEVLTRPGSQVLDGVAIGSRGPVRSVGVFHDLPLETCRSIRLTPHSVTSVRLWKLIAAQRGLALREDPQGEAQLMIGDEALEEWNRRNGAGVLDLGEAWTEWTGKPFVFGVWALGPKVEIPRGKLDRFRRHVWTESIGVRAWRWTKEKRSISRAVSAISWERKKKRVWRSLGFDPVCHR